MKFGRTVLRMDNFGIPHQAMQLSWGATRESRDSHGKIGWTSLDEIWRTRTLDITWDEAEELVTDRAEWCQRVTQCTLLDVGWTKVYGLRVLQVNMHLLTELDFWYGVILSWWGPWRPFDALCCIRWMTSCLPSTCDSNGYMRYSSWSTYIR